MALGAITVVCAAGPRDTGSGPGQL
ncbi:hypothetical protein FRAAL3569 [Frankia alni ACN14a]|uniref:Uncharacterized protein n=1 Tax=Frankia alni (strain DSM 45986 / CECT 9034 / ACN14a) TaxID=326424 RepID=Q0RJU8_FRAAA|nr:hypothetical protein FRAAL3569 [Frankia alni ACN14a]